LGSEKAKKALFSYEKGNADFSDYFVATINLKNEAQCTVTFDKLAVQSPGFVLLD